MKEILAQDLDFGIKDLGINAAKTYNGKTYQVWELADDEFEKLCSVSEGDWEVDYGMWRSADGSNMSTELTEFNINNKSILAWESEDGLGFKGYDSLLEYLCDEIGASQPRNVSALAFDLARYNNLTLAELFEIYEG